VWHGPPDRRSVGRAEECDRRPERAGLGAVDRRVRPQDEAVQVIGERRVVVPRLDLGKVRRCPKVEADHLGDIGPGARAMVRTANGAIEGVPFTAVLGDVRIEVHVGLSVRSTVTEGR
jgi:hypothetical protein